MYSNDRKTGFSVLDLLVKIIFAALFVFLLIWLFKKNVPNMAPFYSNVFRENIKYMQEAGESYFTDERMPKEVGQSTKISLADMYDKKLILPFVDEDGNSCNQYDSYVSITKQEGYYELKTNLVCNKESDYTVKILGCYTYCEDNNCSKTCRKEQIIEYQFKKLTTKTTTSYSCPSGYKRDGKYCYRTVLVDTESAEKTKTTTKTETINAQITIISGSKTKIPTIITQEPSTTEKVYVSPVVKTTDGKKETVYVNPVKKWIPAKTKTEKSCKTDYKKQYYSCNCTTYRDSDGRSHTTCNTCTRTIPVETCEDKTVVVSEGYYAYSCPSSATNHSGSGSSLKCWYYKTTEGSKSYSCPSNATNHSGSGSSLKCWYTKTTAGKKNYKCSSDANYSEGSGANLKCYKVTNGSYKYSCPSGYTLKGSKCTKTITGTFTELKCDKGYKLEGKVCKKYESEKVKATVKKTTKKGYTYKWSRSSSLSGWTKTGKTRVVEGKEICE